MTTGAPQASVLGPLFFVLCFLPLGYISTHLCLQEIQVHPAASLPQQLPSWITMAILASLLWAPPYRHLPSHPNISLLQSPHRPLRFAPWWSSLPLHIRIIDSRSLFKSRAKTHLHRLLQRPRHCPGGFGKKASITEMRILLLIHDFIYFCPGLSVVLKCHLHYFRACLQRQRGLYSAFNCHKNLSESDIIFRKQPRLHKNQLQVCFPSGFFFRQFTISETSFQRHLSTSTQWQCGQLINTPLCSIIIDFWHPSFRAAVWNTDSSMCRPRWKCTRLMWSAS